MAFDVHAFVTALRADPEAKEAVRRELLTDELLGLPVLVAQLAARVDQLATRLGQLTERMEDGFTKVATALAGLADAQAGTKRGLAELADRPAWGDLSRVAGTAYEVYALHTPRVVAGAVGAAPGTVRRISDGELDAVLDAAEAAGRLSHEETEDLGLANRVFLWERPGQHPVYCVVEASITANAEDVETVMRRARLLARAGVATQPVVIGDRAEPDAAAAMEAGQVGWRRIPEPPVPRRNQPA
ncbi:MAG TPA: hypothetical protein VMW47_11615 [Verrucomicrobiae bacterium]|nr:hypothetical protein [Verrucomicrobiae bacterium]